MPPTITASAAGIASASPPFLVYPWPYRDQLSGTISGDLSAGNAGADVDYFSFRADAECKITITLSGAALLDGASADLLDANGDPVGCVVLVGGQPGDGSIPGVATLE